jgi:hypothetical protein
MTTKDRVREILSDPKNKKLNSTRLAKKSGVSPEEFRSIRTELSGYGTGGISGNLETTEYISALEDKIVEFSENIEKGTGAFTAHLTSEPLSPEEIEKRLKLTGTNWKLVSYWNKEKQTRQGDRYWCISGNVGRKKSDPVTAIDDVLSKYKFSYKPAPIPTINKNFSDKTCAILSLQDVHVGKSTMVPHDIETSVKNCVQNLVGRAYHSAKLDKIILVLGGDLVNMDTFLGYTTSQKTLVDNSMSAYDAYKLAFDLMFWVVNYCKQFCNTLQVVYIPGNHSRLTEAHIAYSLSKCIQSKNIIWDIEYAERKVVVYGNSFLSFEHGDFDVQKSPLTFATEWAKDWGNTKYRTLYTGHYHKKKQIAYITENEINGFTSRILPSLTTLDYYHYSNKWTGNNRGGIIELHSETKGSTGEFRYYE